MRCWLGPRLLWLTGRLMSVCACVLYKKEFSGLALVGSMAVRLSFSFCRC
jgi:hypothetical protein